ncbi:MAG: hypothetical protein WB341_08615 [Terracidiphilus sp.]
MFSEYQRIRLRRSVRSVKFGTEGVIVMFYDFAHPAECAVDFFNQHGQTIAPRLFAGILRLIAQLLIPAG